MKGKRIKKPLQNEVQKDEESAESASSLDSL
jgi:hypothetical protein